MSDHCFAFCYEADDVACSCRQSFNVQFKNDHCHVTMSRRDWQRFGQQIASIVFSLNGGRRGNVDADVILHAAVVNRNSNRNSSTC